MSEKVVRLVDRAGGYSVDGTAELGDWAGEWCKALGEGRHGELRSLVLVAESTDGELAVLGQSIAQQDRARLVGLLTVAAKRLADGEARIEDLRSED